MIEQIIGTAIHFGIQTVFLVAGLWIMIKLQKYDYNVLGLIGSAILASGVDMIPFAGHYLSVSVLLFCIRKVIVADSYTDTLFTVGIGYALMFCMNLFLIASLMGDLRPPIVKAETRETDGENQPAATTNRASPATAETAPATKAKEKSAPADSSAKTPVASATETISSVPVNATGNANEASAARLALDSVHKFKLKGISKSASRTLAIINTGTKTETLSRNESIQVETAEGWVAVRCEDVGENKVVLNVEGEKFTLIMH